MKLYGQRGPEFAPGSRWEYSNYGFLLLGVIIERVSGKSYYDYVSENIYGASRHDLHRLFAGGSKCSGSLRLAIRIFGGDGLRPNTDTLPYRGTSAGGGYCTVEDFLRFANALSQSQIVECAKHRAAHNRKGRYATRGKVCFRLHGRRFRHSHAPFRARRRRPGNERRPRNLSPKRLCHRGAFESGPAQLPAVSPISS